MKPSIDLLQEKKIRVLFYLVGIMASVGTFYAFYSKRKQKKEQDELHALELQLKKMQIERLQKLKEQGN